MRLIFGTGVANWKQRLLAFSVGKLGGLREHTILSTSSWEKEVSCGNRYKSEDEWTRFVYWNGFVNLTTCFSYSSLLLFPSTKLSYLISVILLNLTIIRIFKLTVWITGSITIFLSYHRYSEYIKSIFIPFLKTFSKIK